MKATAATSSPSCHPTRQALPELPPPPPPKPPPLNEKPEIPPTQIDNVLQPILGPSVGTGIDIGVPIPDADVSGLAFFEGDLDRKPRALVRHTQYPYRAQRLQIEGVVKVRFTVLQDGSVRDVQILSATPEGIFEEAVMQAVPRWKYEPGLVGGKPVVWTNITEVIFALDP